MNTNRKETIKHCIAASILILAVCIVISIIIKYQVKGETDMPFNLSKITIISTAEGSEKALQEGEEPTKWNMDINQNNDIYIFIDKNDEYKKETKIESITIENISVDALPKKGTVKAYMPSSKEGRTFVNNEDFLVKDKLTYTGAKTSNEKNLEIGNQGGKVLIRFTNTGVTTYKSNEDTEVVHDGTLLAKTGVVNEEINFKVSFDFIMSIGKIKYKAKINLNLPYGDILTEGTSQIEKTELRDIIFKRM